MHAAMDAIQARIRHYELRRELAVALAKGLAALIARMFA